MKLIYNRSKLSWLPRVHRAVFPPIKDCKLPKVWILQVPQIGVKEYQIWPLSLFRWKITRFNCLWGLWFLACFLVTPPALRREKENSTGMFFTLHLPKSSKWKKGSIVSEGKQTDETRLKTCERERLGLAYCTLTWASELCVPHCLSVCWLLCHQASGKDQINLCVCVRVHMRASHPSMRALFMRESIPGPGTHDRWGPFWGRICDQMCPSKLTKLSRWYSS